MFCICNTNEGCWEIPIGECWNYNTVKERRDKTHKEPQETILYICWTVKELKADFLNKPVLWHSLFSPNTLQIWILPKTSEWYNGLVTKLRQFLTTQAAGTLEFDRGIHLQNCLSQRHYDLSISCHMRLHSIRSRFLHQIFTQQTREGLLSVYPFYLLSVHNSWDYQMHLGHPSSHRYT